MRQINKLEHGRQVTADALAPLVDNVRKLSNLSGIGCTVSELPSGIAINVPLPVKIARARLLQDFPACGRAQAVLSCLNQQTGLINPPANLAPIADSSSMGAPGIAPADVITVNDPMDTISNDLLALEGEDGSFYLPAGLCIYVWQLYDGLGMWEPGRPGLCCRLSEESSEESEASEESSEQSSEESEGQSGSSGCVATVTFNDGTANGCVATLYPSGAMFNGCEILAGSGPCGSFNLSSNGPGAGWTLMSGDGLFWNAADAYGSYAPGNASAELFAAIVFVSLEDCPDLCGGSSEGSSEGSGCGGSGELPPCPTDGCPHWEMINDCNGNPTGQYMLVCGEASGS